MKRLAVPVAFLLATTVLAGCADDAPDHAHGEDYVCEDGTVVMAENFTGHHDDNFTLADQCPTDVPPLAFTLELGIASPIAYQVVPVSWSITPTSNPEGHSMMTQVRVSTTPADEAALAGPETFGTEVAKQEHQNTPASFSGEWTPTEAGTYYLRAYGDNLGQGHYWSDELSVEVNPVEPTGVVHTIVVGPGGPVAELDPSSLSMTVGDAVTWRNDDLFVHRFVSTSGPVEFETEDIPQQGASTPIVLLAPGSYSYTNEGDAALIQPITGSIQVNLPAAG